MKIKYLYYKYIHCPLFGHKIIKTKIENKTETPFQLKASNKTIVAFVFGMGKAYKYFYLFSCPRCGRWRITKKLTDKDKLL